jgi:hypothetical protein
MNKQNIFFIIISIVMVALLSYFTYTYVSNVSKAPVYACYYGTIEPSKPGQLYSNVLSNEQYQTAFFRTYCKPVSEDNGCPVTHHFGRYMGDLIVVGGVI